MDTRITPGSHDNAEAALPLLDWNRHEVLVMFPAGKGTEGGNGVRRARRFKFLDHDQKDDGGKTVARQGMTGRQGFRNDGNREKMT